MNRLLMSALIISLLLTGISYGQQEVLRPVSLSPDHNHERFEVQPREHVMEFRAYTASFDLDDDDDGDGEADQLGLSAWVSYQLNRGSATGHDARPDDWIAISNLPSSVKSPTDESYHRSNYSRGHVCMRQHAQRLGADANYNTFCVVNAMPQKQGFNGGIWLSLERLCSLWSDKYEKIWVTCGPVFLDGETIKTIGDRGEVKVAIPHAFYKVVARENPDNPDVPLVLAFVYEHDPGLRDSSASADHRPYLVSVDEIEELTGLDFFANLSDDIQAEIESDSATEIWDRDIDANVASMMRGIMSGQQVDGELLQDLVQIQRKSMANEALAARAERQMGFDELLVRGGRIAAPSLMRTVRGSGIENLLERVSEIERLQNRVQQLEERLDALEGERNKKDSENRSDASPLLERIRKSLSSNRTFSGEDVAAPDEDDGDAIDSEIQIGTYNLELLGKGRRPFRGTERPEREREDLEEIVDRVVNELDLEIIVFQEINTESRAWSQLKSMLHEHGYKFKEGTASGRDQFVVLAWDADEVDATRDSLQELDVSTDYSLSSGCGSLGLRKPVAGLFKAGEFDFWVVGVHLKSRIGGSCANRIRKEQCKEMVGEIDKLVETSNERDVIIVGDFNNEIDHYSFAPLTESNFTFQTRFLKAGSAEGSYVKTSNPQSSGDLIDHIALRYSDTREVVRNSTFVYGFESRSEGLDYVIRQSDHIPVWTSFYTDTDLDDE